MKKYKKYRLIPDKMNHWEILSAWSFNIDPKDLFLKSKRRDVTSARFFCMKYMMEELKYSTTDAGGRYGLTNTDAISGRKRVNNNDFLKEKYKTFINLCDRQSINGTIMEDPLNTNDIASLKNIAFNAWTQYASLIHLIGKFDKGNCNETEIINKVIIAEMNLKSIKKIFIK